MMSYIGNYAVYAVFRRKQHRRMNYAVFRRKQHRRMNYAVFRRKQHRRKNYAVFRRKQHRRMSYAVFRRKQHKRTNYVVYTVSKKKRHRRTHYAVYSRKKHWRKVMRDLEEISICDRNDTVLGSLTAWRTIAELAGDSTSNMPRYAVFRTQNRKTMTQHSAQYKVKKRKLAQFGKTKLRWIE